MAWAALLMACLALAAGALWLAERARRRQGESASLRREAASAAAARAARDDAEARFRAALLDAGVGIGMAQVDGAGLLLDCNEALARLLGRPPASLLRRPLTDAMAPGERESFQVALGALVRGAREREDAERVFLGPGGEPRRLRVTLAALRDETGAFRSAIGLLEDVTERAALLDRLAEADRLAALGALTAGVVHQLRDPLAYVVGNLAFAREALSAGAGAAPEALAQARQALDEAHQGVSRVEQLLGDVRALSRPASGRSEPVDAATALRAALRLAEGELKGLADVELQVLPAPPVHGDPARLGQALLGLLLDVVRTVPPAAPGAPPDPWRVRLAVAPTADGRVRLEIGVERPGEAAPQATSRAGPPPAADPAPALEACRRTVEAMGGELTARAVPGRSRVVTLLLPATPPADRLTPVAPHGEAAPQAAGPRGRVLVVDDEPYVGKTLRRILEQSHDVEVAASGRAALERLAAGPSPDVILCDLMMPGMTGMELHAELAARSPTAAARMVFVTGGALHEPARLFLERIANPVLEKPLQPELLRRVVAESVRRGVAALPADLDARAGAAR